jgi:hypothetical protein
VSGLHTTFRQPDHLAFQHAREHVVDRLLADRREEVAARLPDVLARGRWVFHEMVQTLTPHLTFC